jgi:hypothetical protein
MRFNLLTVSALLAFAACDDKSDSGSTDADADADTDADTDTDTATETGTPPDDGPWTPGYYSYSFDGTVDATGNLVNTIVSDGTSFPPSLYIDIASEDYFDGSDDEACTIIVDISHATPATPIANAYATWSVDAAASASITDGCAGLTEMVYGAYPADIWSTLQYTISLAPYNSELFDPYFPATYSDLFVGGFFTDGISYIGTDTATAYPFLYDTFGEGYGDNGSGGYLPDPLPASDVPNPYGGVVPGFYYQFSVFLYGLYY